MVRTRDVLCQTMDPVVLTIGCQADIIQKPSENKQRGDHDKKPKANNKRQSSNLIPNTGDKSLQLEIVVSQLKEARDEKDHLSDQLVD